MKSGIYESVCDAVFVSKKAFERYTEFTLNERQEIIEAIKKALRPLVNDLARITVAETDMGNISDKAKKISLAIEKTPGVENLTTEVSTGDHGMTLYEISPYGVTCAVQPCTNPCATLISNTIALLSAGNSVIHCPHPRAMRVSQLVTEIINKSIVEVCGVHNLVVTLDESLIKYTLELMNHPDVELVVFTGGNTGLQSALSSQKKVIAAGPANPVAIVDETADIKKAAKDIFLGSSFDNNLMCTSEKSVVLVESIADKFIEEIKINEVYFITSEMEKEKLLNTIITEDGNVNKKLEGKNANLILDESGIEVDKTIKLIVFEDSCYGAAVIKEIFMPVLPIVRAKNFDEALDKAIEIEQGFKHTSSMFSESIEHLNRAAKKMQTSIFVKNGPSYLGIGFDEEGDTTFTIANVTGEGSTTAKNFGRKRRCILTTGFSIR